MQPGATDGAAVAEPGRLKNEPDKHGRGEPRGPERRRHQARDVQGHIEEDSRDAALEAHRSPRQLRPHTERVLLRQAPGRLRPGVELLSHGQTALSHGRVRPALRGGARLLGPRLQSGGTMLLDDLHSGTFLSFVIVLATNYPLSCSFYVHVTLHLSVIINVTCKYFNVRCT